MALQIRRGTYAEAQQIVPLEGELVYTTDTKELFIGDGIVYGGVLISQDLENFTVTSTTGTTIISDSASTGTIVIKNVASGYQVAVSTTGTTVTGPIFIGTATLNTLIFSSDGTPITSRAELLGYTGSRGFTGSLGSTGPQGPQGFTGSKGDIGFTGSLGAQGAIGFTGSLGAQGAQGLQGAQGPIGYTGSLGAQGAQGQIGFTGSKGVDGVIGYNGSVGYTGSQGETGYVGSRGLAGQDGDRYHTQSTSTLTIANAGTLTLYTADLNLDYSQQQTIIIAYSEGNHMHGQVVSYNGATGELVVNLNNSTGSGSYSQWEINLDGAVGIRGYTGSLGDKGFTGSQGAIGYTGSLGAQGYTGSEGATGGLGYTGSIGLGFTVLDGTNKNVGGGTSALDSLTSGSDNTALGYEAGTAITDGIMNTIIGSEAGKAISSGNHNVIIGRNAMSQATAPGYDVVIGAEAMTGYTAGGNTRNVVIGNNAATDLTSGESNVIIGQGAGSGLTSGDYNVILGRGLPVAGLNTGTFIVGFNNIATSQNITRLRVDDNSFGIEQPIKRITTDANLELEPNGTGKIRVKVTDNSTGFEVVQTDQNYTMLTVNNGSGGQMLVYGQENGTPVNTLGVTSGQVDINANTIYFAANTLTNTATISVVVPDREIRLTNSDGATPYAKFGPTESRIYGHLQPSADSTYDLGSTATQWRSLYVSTSTIYIGGNSLSVQDGALSLNNSTVVGYTGSTGATGYTGSQGDAGSAGATGYTGSQGDAGTMGSPGPTGYTGSQGNAGSQGGIGYTGSAGVSANQTLDTTSNVTFSALTVTNQTHLASIKESIYSWGNTAAGTYTINVSSGTIHTMTLTGNVTISAFANPVTGTSAMIIITQDGVGSRTLTSTMKFASGNKTLTTTASATDIMSVFYDGTNYWASLAKGYA